MTWAYSEFDSTPATIVADIKAKILLSTDWSNPTGQVVQATSALGAQMVMDLNPTGATADNQRIRPKVWRAFSGGTGTDSVQRSLYWNQSGNNSAAQLHCKVSAGNTLLYIEIEGPRPGETAVDQVTYGSLRQCLFLSQITPYLVADVTPAVFFGGSTSYPFGETPNLSGTTNYFSHVSRNQAATAAWVSARLWAPGPIHMNQAQAIHSYQPIASDGSVVNFPWMVMEDAAGYRGRLTDLHYCGSNQSYGDYLANFGPGTDLSYGGNTYRITAPYKANGTNMQVGGSFGMPANNSSGTFFVSPLVAVRRA